MRGDPRARDPRRARDRDRGGDGDGAGRAPIERDRHPRPARGARRCERPARRLAADGDQPRLGARALRRRHRRRRTARRTSCARRSPRSPVASTTTRSRAAARWAATARSCSPPGARVLTHCNAGGLATGGYGSALGVVRAAHARDPGIHVWVGETRPLLQGARLTAWELAEDGIPHTLIADVAAGQLFARGLVDAVVFGADRIARNGDAANKIGSYTLSVLAAAHGVPCYVVAPSSTIDHAIASGADIPIEERAGDEVTQLGGRALAPGGHAGRESRLRRHAGGQHHRDRHRGGRAPRAVRAEPAGRGDLTAGRRPTLPARSATDTSHGPLVAWPHVLSRLAPPPRAAAPLRRLPATGRVDVRRLRPARARPGRARCAGAAAHRRRSSVGTCRACARLRWFTTARSALWLEGPVLDVVARWKRGEISPARLAGAFVAHELPRPRVEAIAVVPAVRDRRLQRGADPPAELARGARRAGGTCRSCRSCAARAACARSAASTPPRAAATCGTRSPRARAPLAWRSSTTSTRPAPPSTSAPGRCCERARSRST